MILREPIPRPFTTGSFLLRETVSTSFCLCDLRVIVGSNWTIPTASVISSKPAMPQCKTSRAAKPPGEAIIEPSSFVTGGEGIPPQSLRSQAVVTSTLQSIFKSLPVPAPRKEFLRLRAFLSEVNTCFSLHTLFSFLQKFTQKMEALASIYLSHRKHYLTGRICPTPAALMVVCAVSSPECGLNT
jgi:hypothetical protein